MAYAGAIFLSAAFIALARALGLVSRPLEVAATSMQALRVLADPALHDDTKEAVMRQHARRLAWLFLRISGGAIVAAGVPLGIVWVLSAAGLLSLDAVLEALVSWQMLVGGVAFLAVQAWRDRVRLHGTR